MSDRRKDLRPREKLQAKGAEALSDYELLMAIIGSGTQYADVTKLAREVQKLLKEKGSELAYEDLLNVKSLGPAKATNIMAGFELWRRKFEVSERPIIDSPEKAVEQLVDIRDKKQEYFVCLTLDGANRLIASASLPLARSLLAWFIRAKSLPKPYLIAPPVSSWRIITPVAALMPQPMTCSSLIVLKTQRNCSVFRCYGICWLRQNLIQQ